MEKGSPITAKEKTAASSLILQIITAWLFVLSDFTSSLTRESKLHIWLTLLVLFALNLVPFGASIWYLNWRRIKRRNDINPDLTSKLATYFVLFATILPIFIERFRHAGE